MSQSKRLFALLFSVMLAFALVPATALAEATAGRIDDSSSNTGTITISNAKANETYDIWQMFKLISFRDSDPSTGAHPTAEEVSASDYETYSYAIEHSENEASWYYFLTHYGPDGSANSATPYAVLSTDTSAKAEAAYFIINAQTSTITLPDSSTLSYQVIKANRARSFMNDWDSPDSTSSRNDEGEPANDGINYSDTAATNGTKTNLNYNAVQDFAQAAVAYARAKNIRPSFTQTAPSVNPTVSFENVPIGYYLMSTSMGALASLDTTNPIVNIYEKNDEPAIEKSVLEKGQTVGLVTPGYLTGTTGDGAAWVANTDADINDLVQFRTIITAQQGADSYVLHDVMESGFEFVATDAAPQNTNVNSYAGIPSSGYTYSPKVYLVKGGSTVYSVSNTASVPIDGGNSQSANNWAIVSGNSVTNADGCDFEITFMDGDASVSARAKEYEVVFGATKVYESGAAVANAQPEWVEITDGDKIVVTYWARVTPLAAVFGTEAAGANAAAVPVNDHGDSNTVSIANQPDREHNANGKNDNHTILTYGKKSYTAAFQTASVTTYGFDITKTLEAGLNGAGTSEYALLDGAEFSVYKVVDETSSNASFTPQNSNETVYYNTTNKLKFMEGQTDDGQQTLLTAGYADTHTFYRYAGDAAAATDTTTTVVSKDGKAMHLYGLEAGAYVIVEDKAPSGYNKLAHPVVITVVGPQASGSTETEGNIYTYFHPNTSTGSYDKSSITWKSTITAGTPGNPNIYTETGNGGAHIVNQTGKELPSTGGMGTTVFYVVGGVLVIGAVVLFVTKRRVGTSA